MCCNVALSAFSVSQGEELSRHSFTACSRSVTLVEVFKENEQDGRGVITDALVLINKERRALEGMPRVVVVEARAQQAAVMPVAAGNCSSQKKFTPSSSSSANFKSSTAPPCNQKMTLAIDLLNPSAAAESRRHKLKRLVQSPNSYFMDVKCPGCFAITTVFSHAQTVVLCGACTSVLCQPTGGKARLTEGASPLISRYR
ncbi:ribosomal protein S27-domain-containing protein [Cytidiella melzeri]|nr:ribosomal protein S27-domain-containing protein [Cytidiella melzeri]